MVSLVGIGQINPALVKPRTATRRRARRGLALLIGACCLFLVFLSPALAGDGSLDPTFNPGAGVTSSAALFWAYNYSDSSGKMLMIGAFEHMGGYARSGIARLNPDGSVDPSFNAAVASYGSGTGYVSNCILLNPGDSNSQIIIAGEFTIASDSGTYYGLARLNSNGTVDSSFAHTFSSGDGVFYLANQSDGKLYVGGSAMSVNGYGGQAYNLLRLKADGTVDGTYPMRSAPGGYVNFIWTDLNGLATGQVRLFGTIPSWTLANHTYYEALVGADGSSVLQSIGDDVVNGPILHMATQGSNTIIVGSFTRVYDAGSATWKQIEGIARLLPNGTLDTTFNLGSGANGHIKRVNVEPSGKLVLNGYFTSFNGTPCGFLVRLNYDGTLDNTFNSGTGAGDRIWNAGRQSDGSYLLYGAFQSYNGSPRQCFAKINNDGSINSQFASFTTDYQPSSQVVYAVQESYSIQGVYMAGAMGAYGGKLHRRVARANFGGTPDQSFRAGLGGVVYSLRPQPDGKVLVAGHFSMGTGYVSCTSLGRLLTDGTMDLDFKPVLAKADGTIPDLYWVDTMDNGQIWVAGDFAQIADANHVMQARSGIARLNANGTLDPSFNAQISIPGASNIIVKIGGSYDHTAPCLVGGSCIYQGSPAGFYARLTTTGALDTTFGPAGGSAPHVNLFNGEVKCGTEQSDGKIILGGDFTQMMAGSQVGYLARFSVNGLVDNTFSANPGANGPIYAIQSQRPSDKFFIGGAFTTYKGVGRNRLARLNPDGSLDSNFNTGTGANDAVYALEYDDYNHRVYIGGAFTTYNGVSRPRIARLMAGVNLNPATLMLLLSD